MRILVTNDDGIRAEGLASLVRVANRLGQVKVVAPDRERSACGHAMTIRDPLRVKPVDWASMRISDAEYAPRDLTPDAQNGVEAFEVNGLPVDCVNTALCVAWPDGCDLVLSGINHGPNCGFDVTYSGTVGGAMEGAINGIKSFAVSMALFVEGSPLHLDTAERWLGENLRSLVDGPWRPLTFLNINIPAIQYQELRGSRVVGMGKRVYDDRVEMRTDPWGRPYFWQGGSVAMNTEEQNTDINAVSQGFVSITPVGLDWTHTAMAEELRAHLTHAGEASRS